MAKVGDTRVIICQDGSDGSADATSFMLPGPQGDRRLPYMAAGGTLQEVAWFKEKFASWFAGDAVIEDGSMYVATPVDPLFLLLPVLEAVRGSSEAKPEGMFTDLEQILTSADPSLVSSSRDAIAGSLGCVCEKKVAGGQEYYRMSDDRVMGWLCCKVESCAEFLKSTGGQAFAGLTEDLLDTYAVEVLEEYLAPKWSEALREEFGVKEEVKQEPTAENYSRARSQFDDLGDISPAKKAKSAAAAKAAATEAKRAETKKAKNAQAAKGMQRLSAFFGKPAAKA